jgi:sensor histidine kinase YesM
MSGAAGDGALNVPEGMNRVSVSPVSLVGIFWYVPVIILVLVIVSVVFVRAQLKAIRKREKEKTRLQQQLYQSEMRALRSQMNPHFIFNAINSIQHYVLTNEKDLANKYLVKFSKLMRNILDLSKEELISLSEELETVKLYLEIEALRFNNAFTFSFNVSDDIDPNFVKIPPLLIQPFVENAIWHGLLPKEGEKRLDIDVSSRKNIVMIVINDNGIGREAAQKFKANSDLQRRSLGMDITQDRLNVIREIHGIFITFNVLDKIDPAGNPLGTNVVIELKQNN